eukprot:ANDGO_00893.mRNA.1 putative serine incorporator
MDSCNDDGCRGLFAVFRICWAMFIFFAVHLILTLMFKTSPEFKVSVQRDWWFFKIIFFFGLIVAAFFIRNGVFVGFAYLFLILGALFVVMQVLILIDFAYDWNDSWVKKEKNSYLAGLLAVSLLLFVAGLVVVGFMYYWFTTDGACHLNKFFISMTLIFGVVTTILSLRVKHGALLPCAVVFATTVYWTWSAIFSEPSSSGCNSLRGSSRFETAQIVISVTLACLSMVYTVMRTTSQTQAFSTEKPEEEELKKEKYWLFHTIMVVASGYCSAAFSNWSFDGSTDVSSIDEGWVSTGIKIAATWLAALLYIWSLIAPYVFKNRDFGWD